MDLRKADLLKSNALDALYRGKKPEATRAYQELIEMYELYPFMLDARLALYFNTLLAYLDRHDSPQADQVIEQMIFVLEQFEEPSFLSKEVGTRLCLLLAQPIAQVDEELQTHLHHLASKHGVPTTNYRDLRFVLDEVIRPNTLAQLSPADSGLLCYVLVNQATNKDSTRAWLNRVYRRHRLSPPIPQEIQEELDTFSAAYRERLFIDAYQALLKALDWAVDRVPFLAFEWSLGLISMEQFPELERLNFLPRLPLERRVELTVQLHRQLALDLIDEGEAERLALHHWQEVINLGLHRLHMIEHRNEVRRSVQSGDVEAKGWAAVWIAEGLSAQGAFTRALSLLNEPRQQANRRSYNDLRLTTTIFRLCGSLHERRSDEMSAQDDYFGAIQSGLPGLLNLENLEDVEPVIEHIRCGLDPHVFYASVKSYVDLVRLGNFKPSALRINLIRYVISQSRMYVAHNVHAELSMYVELTAARLGEFEAAYHALECARIIDHRSGVSLSLLHICKQNEIEAKSDTTRLARLTNEYKRASREARRAGGSNIQRRLRLNEALLLLKQSLRPQYHKLDDSNQDDASLEQQFQLLFDEISSTILSDQSGDLDLLLPYFKLDELEQATQSLLERRFIKSARYLCGVLRLLDRKFFYVSPRRDFTLNIRQMHCDRFMAKWVDQDEVPAKLYRAYNTLITRNDTPRWPQRALNIREARLEYRVFDQWAVGFLVTHQQGIITQTIQATTSTLRAHISELIGALSPGGEDFNLLRESASNLYELLIEPFEPALAQVHRLTIVPDGPLNALPFSLLTTRSKHYLIEKMEIAIACPTAEPVFPAVAPKDVPVFYAIGNAPDVDQVCQKLSVLRDENGFHNMSTFSPNAFKDLTLAAGQVGVHTVYLEGHTTSDATIRFSEQEEPMPIEQAIHSLASLNTACCILAGPIDREMSQSMIRTLLTAVHGGLLVSHWKSPYHLTFLKEVLTRAIDSYQPIGLIEAMANARRMAIQERRTPTEWAGFELYISEFQ